jgi:uncharacterized protein YecT (DUF1311 family)
MLSLLVVAAAAALNMTPCPGANTLELNACLNARLERSDATLNRYYRTALSRISKENGGKPAETFIKAERSWIAYRDSECSSVFERYGGTIRVSVGLECSIRLTGLRTYAIWRDWLTYPDSTPPLLRRPDVESVLSDR